jgi:uncharacterized membrane protein YhaH (DUF805 family)
MLAFFFNPIGRSRPYEFTLGWLFWQALELGFWFGFAAKKPETAAYTAWYFAAIAVSGLSTVSLVCLGVKRLRDAALPLFPAFILLVPIVSLIALVVMSRLPSVQSGASDAI